MVSRRNAGIDRYRQLETALQKATNESGNDMKKKKEVLVYDNAYQVTEELKLQLYCFQAVHQLQQQDMAEGIQYSHRLHHFVHEGAHV